MWTKIKDLLPVASTLVSGIFGQSTQSKYLSQQQQANNHAFEQNKQLAQQQNEFNIAQWNRENEYNLPANQMQRLREAGLNPDLVYGSGVSGLTSASSPSMSAGTPISPVDYTLGGKRKTVGEVFNDVTNTALATAQINKMKAETKGQEETNKSIYQLDQAELRQRMLNHGYTQKQIEEFDYLFNKYTVEMDATRTTIESMRATIASLEAGTEIAWFNAKLNEKSVEQQIKTLASQQGLNEQQIKQMQSLLPYEIRRLNDLHDMSDIEYEERYTHIILNLAQRSGILSENEVKEYEAFVAQSKLEYYRDNPESIKQDIRIDKVDRVVTIAEKISHIINECIRTFIDASSDDSGKSAKILSAISKSK